MNDDWRVRVTLLEPDDARELVDGTALRLLEQELPATVHDRVIVSHDDREVFVYADTREQAERVEQDIRTVAAKLGWEPEFELTHWHPTAEAWEHPDTPLPETDAERAAEHAEMVANERERERDQGYPDYEVRVQTASHHDAVELAQKLRKKGTPSAQRWKYLLVGALDEDAANALATTIRELAPATAEVTVEGTVASAEATEPRNRYAIFSGIFG